MTVLFDIAASTFIAGMIILTIVALNGAISDTGFEATMSVAVQEDISDLAGIIEYDFYKIGYSADPTFNDAAFLYADSTEVIFRADIDRDSTADVIAYFLQDPVAKIPTYKQLFRKVNSNSPKLIGTGIVDFRLQYFNALGKPLTGFSPTESTTLDSIRSVRIQVKLQSIILADTIYGGTYWEKYISPKNL